MKFRGFKRFEIFNAVLLYDRKKGLPEKEQLRAWKLYLDTAKIRRKSGQYLKDFAG